jgi:PhnB protein
MAVKAIPEGYHSVTPYLIVGNAPKALEFYQRAFGAKELMRMADPSSGRIGHAEIKIGDSIVMLADEHRELGIVGPRSGERPPVSILLYVEDVDTVYRRALAAGASSLSEPADQFYGDRNAQITDPFGQVWFLATHVEDVSEDEMKKRIQSSAKSSS